MGGISQENLQVNPLTWESTLEVRIGYTHSHDPLSLTHIFIIVANGIIMVMVTVSGEPRPDQRLWLLHLCCLQPVGGDQASGVDYNDGHDDDDNNGDYC